MRKLILFLASIFCLASVSGQNRKQIIPYDSTAHYQRLFADNSEFDIRKFTPMPEYDRREWIDAIKPIPGYKYWEWRYSDRDAVFMRRPGELIAYQGERVPYGALVALKIPDHGFFMGGGHRISYSYIVAVAGNCTVDEDSIMNEDWRADMIDSDEKLIEFLGAVDNIEEALLQIMARGYSVDNHSPITGAYREENDRFLLYLLKVSEMNSRYESMKVILYKTGKFEVVSAAIYKVNAVWLIE